MTGGNSFGDDPSTLPLTPEEQAAERAFREELKAAGWTEDEEGNLLSPLPDSDQDDK